MKHKTLFPFALAIVVLMAAALFLTYLLKRVLVF